MVKEVKGSAAESYMHAQVWFGICGLILIGLFMFGLVNFDDEPVVPAPGSSPPVLQITGQPGVWDRFPQACRYPASEGPISPDCLEGFSQAEREAMCCLTKDGNQNGIPCIWLKPSTLELFYIDGSPK